MIEQLQARLAELLRRPRALPPQTERQLGLHLAEHRSSSIESFLLGAADLLQEYELDVAFAPVFTPTLDERAELADLLFHWRPTTQQLDALIPRLRDELRHATVLLPDGSTAKLTLHEVMVERFVRLLRLDSAAEASVAAALRDALPAELWPVGVALLCERGMTPAHQKWFAAFVNHLASHRRPVTRELLETIATFAASQTNLSNTAMLAAAEALMRASESTTAYTSAGHSYWSGDVAQHHHYRGQGNIDKERLAAQQAELERVTAMVEELKSFESSNDEARNPNQ